MEPITDLLLRHAEQTPEAVAIVAAEGETTSTITYGQLGTRVRRLAAVLRAHGVPAGGRVGLWLPEGRWVEHTTSYFAVLLAGGVAVVLPTDASAKTLHRIASDVGLSLVLADAGAETSWTQVPHLPIASPPGAGPDVAGGPGVAGVADGTPPLAALADVIFTSGSTGSPKGVAASHATLAGIATGYRMRAGGARVVGHGLSHATAIGTRQLLIAAIARGATLVSCVPFQAGRFLHLAAATGVGTAVLPAAAGRSLVQALEADGAAAPSTLRSLRFVSDQLRPALHRRLAALLPATKVINTYGLTEGGDAHLIVTAEDCHLGPGGHPAPGTEVRIRTWDGQWAAPGVQGVICIRDKKEPLTYLTGTAWAQQVWHDGWTRTGDLGSIDDNGRVRIEGRIEAHARVGGHTVVLATVREALEAHPAIHTAAVVPLSHPTLGQSLGAVVEADAELDQAEVRTFLLQTIPDFAVPTSILRTDRIPLSRSGKPLLEAIEQQLLAHRAPVPEPCHTDLEKAISAIWAQVLENNREYGRNESFLELGGDSLAAIQVLTQLEEIVGRELPPETLTTTANLGEFAAAVEQLGARP